MLPHLPSCLASPTADIAAKQTFGTGAVHKTAPLTFTILREEGRN